MNKTEFPETSKLIDAADKSTPMQFLQAAYADAPDVVKGHLDQAAMEILMVEIPKLRLVAQVGPIVQRDKLSTVEKVFASAIEMAELQAPEIAKRISASSREAGLSIARAIDQGFKVALLEDDVVNHMAYVDAMAAHAKLVRCVENIALTLQQRESQDKCLRAEKKKDGDAA